MRTRLLALILVFLPALLTAAGPSLPSGSGKPHAAAVSAATRGGPGVAEVIEASTREGAEAADSPWRDVYLVQLADDPLASYRGGIPGLEATSPQVLGTRKLDPERPAVQLYRSYLAQKQDEAFASIEQTLGHSVTVLRRYDAAFHGVAVRLTPEEADRVRRLRGVVKVYRNEFREPATDVGPAWIGAPGIWSGTTTGGLPGTRGEGVIVGVIDSGINSNHPSFADVGGDGFNHINPLGAGVYRGWCNAGFPVLITCNDKLIGTWSYPESGNNPEDDDGHGSHTTSTAAGNVVTATLNAPTTSFVAGISGVAPHANIIAYDACLGSCPTTALVASVNQAVLDGVDVINYSITGGTDPYNDAVSVAFLNATASGVFISAAAENGGPGASTVGHSEPWVQTVGASTHNRKIINRLTGMTGGTAPPADMAGAGLTAGYGPAPIVYAGSFGDPLCPLGAFPPGTFSGQIVVCDRGGGIGRVDKAQSVLNGGAGGFVLANDAVNGNALVADPYPLPGVHITFTDGVALKSWLATGTGHMANISGWLLDLNPANGDIMADFSARGPSSSLPDLLKPDVTAPGVDVFAADQNGPPPEYQLLSGTSMAAPHSTGAAALIRALHPTWTPPMIKSALMLTTVTTVRKEDGTTPADSFDMGAGRIDLSRAGFPGFVLDETYSNFAAANPAAAGDPTTLNLASLADASCFQTCSWQRTLLSVVGASRTWTGTVSSPPGVIVTIPTGNPFVLPAGSARNIDVTVNVSAAPKNQWHFASITWSDGPGNSPDLRMPLAVFAQGSTDALTLSKTVDAAVTSPDARLNYSIQVSNRSSIPTNFTVTDPIPANTTYIPGSETGGLTFHPGTNTLTGTTGLLAGLRPTVSASPSPFGYVPPASLSGVFNICTLTAQCDETVLTLTGVDIFYLGVRYTQMNVSSNGYIQPGSPAAGLNFFINQNLPDPTDPDHVVAPFWADLDMNGTSATDPGGGFYYFATYQDPATGDEYLVLGWENAQLFGDPSHSYTFQIWNKFGTDQIWFVYQEIGGGLPDGPDGGLTVGVENLDGTSGHSYFYRPLGSCVPGCSGDSGTPPAIGTDLKVNSLAAVATFDFSVTVDSGVPPGTHVQNIVTATDGTRTYQAVADTVVSLPAVGITVTPTSGLTTTEAGGTAQFTIVLLSAPTAPVTIDLSSDDTSEGTVSPPSVTFDTADWSTPKTVTVTGVDDLLDDGDVVYHVVTATAVSADTRYELNPADVTVTNLDDDTVEGSYFTITPCRLVDTRVTGNPLPSGFPVELLIRGQCGVASTARAVAMNVAAVGASGLGSLTVYPFSGVVPGTHSVSFRAGDARAALSVIGLDSNGRIGAVANVTGGGTVHLIIDVSGYFE